MKIALVLGVIAAVFLIAIGVDWLIWLAWCWAIPQLWPTAPLHLAQPGFLLFLVAVTVVQFLGKSIFGRSKSA